MLLRIERARFKRRVIRTLAVASVATALVVSNAEAIEAWIAADVWHVWTVALGVLIVMFSLSGLPIEALPVFRGIAHPWTLARSGAYLVIFRCTPAQHSVCTSHFDDVGIPPDEELKSIEA